MRSSLSRSSSLSSESVPVSSANGYPFSGSSTCDATPSSDNTMRNESVEGKTLNGPDEHAPLLGRSSSSDDPFLEGQARDGGQDDLQQTKSVWYLILLTISIGGLQIAWSVELSNGSPYLLSLGLSKSLMALVWIAGPLTGTLVQPYVGMLSDNCRIPWGKRKPFMLGGSLATTCALMFLGWTREIVGGILDLFGADPESWGVKVAIIVVAVIWVYVLDFAINTVQAAIRAFIVDCAPPHQQETANAMASRFVGVGNILGYLAGYVNLPQYLWFFGHSQFKVLCSIASIALCSTVLLSSGYIKERDPRLDAPPKKKKEGVITFFLHIPTSIRRLPPQIKKVCMVQFCAWVGFFPMLFYTSSYIGEIYMEPYLEENPHMTPEELDRLYERATRVGTFALLIFAITSLITNIFLPFFIAPTYDASAVPIEAPGGIPEQDSDEKQWTDYLIIPGFTLRRAWMLSHIIFAVSMFCTVLVRTVEAATALVGLVGITWALTLWAPWAIISGEIAQRDALLRVRRQRLGSLIRAVPSDDSADDLLEQERVLQEEEDSDQAGVILGIHNMAIAAPQMLATIGSSIIFRFTQKPRGVPGDHSFAITLAVGGFFALIAAYLVHLIRDSDPTEALSVAEEGDAAPSRPGTAHSRKSTTELPRQSMKRATLARNKSFVGGLEYH